MSLTFKSTIFCDGCTAYIESEPEHRATYVMIAHGKLKRHAAKLGWITLSRGKYRTEAHYCPCCADKPLPKNRSQE